MFPNIQFIVTTHSPFVLNSIENVVIYDLGSKLRVGSEAGLSKLPYSGIVEGYFGASELSAKLMKCRALADWLARHPEGGKAWKK